MNDDRKRGAEEAPDRARTLQHVARDVLRAWLRTEDAYAFDRLGQDAIRASADETVRLGNPGDGGTAERLLSEIETLAGTIAEPAAPPRRWWSRARPEAKPATASDGFATLVDRLDRARDAITRRLIVAQSDRARFEDADLALERALALIRALVPTLEAAAREMRGEDPVRAARLTSVATETLPERERAVLTQVAIHRQAMLTLDLMMQNQATLERALEQARTATVSALQVALAARRAISDGTALAQQGAALSRLTAAAATGDPGDSALHARRMLDDAVAQARAAIAASAAVPRR